MAPFNLSRFGAGVAIACVLMTSHAQMPDTLWRVRVMDSKHHLKVEGTVRFTRESETRSCIGGNWKRAVVVTKALIDDTFFPLTGQLAYEIENDKITLGHTRICDGYLFLTGVLDDKNIHGTFHAPGPGYNEQLGYFSLTKIR